MGDATDGRRIHPMQALVDGMSAQWQRDRADTQWTLGALIKALATMDPARLVRGFGNPGSYRGYYCDLAFNPSNATETAGQLLSRARECMGKVYEGYKGGEYMMGESTPLWLSPWGDASGDRLVGLTDGDPVEPVTSPEEVDHD